MVSFGDVLRVDFSDGVFTKKEHAAIIKQMNNPSGSAL